MRYDFNLGNNSIMKIFIIAICLFILYNMFAKHRCFPMFCFLNQREGLVANRDNIAKNTADITALQNDINSGIARLKALPPTISKNKALIPKHISPNIICFLQEPCMPNHNF